MPTPGARRRPLTERARPSAAERPAQHAAHLGDRLARAAGAGERVNEAVHVAVVAAQERAHAGRAQPCCVRLALVAQRVEAGGDDERRRDGAELAGMQRRYARVAPVGAGGENWSSYQSMFSLVSRKPSAKVRREAATSRRSVAG